MLRRIAAALEWRAQSGEYALTIAEQSLGLSLADSENGVKVESVREGSVAARAGVAVDDVLVSVVRRFSL